MPVRYASAGRVNQTAVKIVETEQAGDTKLANALGRGTVRLRITDFGCATGGR